MCKCILFCLRSLGSLEHPYCLFPSLETIRESFPDFFYLSLELGDHFIETIFIFASRRCSGTVVSSDCCEQGIILVDSFRTSDTPSGDIFEIVFHFSIVDDHLFQKDTCRSTIDARDRDIETTGIGCGLHSTDDACLETMDDLSLLDSAFTGCPVEGGSDIVDEVRGDPILELHFEIYFIHESIHRCEYPVTCLFLIFELGITEIFF